jgi:ribose 5-phosphate isomerase B
MQIIIGSDHAGYKLKEYLKKKISGLEDIGTYSEDKADYPDIAKKAARTIQKSKNTKAILICGTGTGMCIAANRFRGVRAVLVYDKYSAVMSRKDNDANIICLRGRKTGYTKAKKLVKTWLKQEFSGKARHKRRIKKLDR